MKLFFRHNKYIIGFAVMNVMVAGLLLMDKKYYAAVDVIKKTLSI
ncbi:MAG: hypothetical protein U9P44_03070 [archaeon]|nr:hypothetical protein [archaeon]